MIALVAILATTGATIGLGFYGVRLARTTSDLFVASRAVTPWWNAAAISGEYLSAASFLGIAGLQMKLGSGALWLPLGFTAGYLALLLFVAAPLRRFGAYTISKAALESATRMLAVELGAYGIRVNGVHPGYIWGDSVRAYFEYLAAQRSVSPQDVYDEVAAETCLKYLPDAAQIAGSVLFFASELSDPVTGQSLGVNAGHWLH